MDSKSHNSLEEVKNSYPEFFENCKVLELGSRNINGSVRRHFNSCEFVGVDWVDGRDVDVVCKAHQTDFKKEYFDTLISFSTFEHDPYWERTISHNLPFLKKGGLIVFKWSTPGSPPHGVGYAPDVDSKITKIAVSHGNSSPEYQKILSKIQGHYYPKALDDVKEHLEKKGIEIIKAWEIEAHKVVLVAKK